MRASKSANVIASSLPLADAELGARIEPLVRRARHVHEMQQDRLGRIARVR